MTLTTQPGTQLANLHKVPLNTVMRYGLAFVTIMVALALRMALVIWVGPGLPPYVTFYPAVTRKVKSRRSFRSVFLKWSALVAAMKRW